MENILEVKNIGKKYQNKEGEILVIGEGAVYLINTLIKIKRMKFMLLIIPLLVLILLDLYVFWDQVDVENPHYYQLLQD